MNDDSAGPFGGDDDVVERFVTAAGWANACREWARRFPDEVVASADTAHGMAVFDPEVGVWRIPHTGAVLDDDQVRGDEEKVGIWVVDEVLGFLPEADITSAFLANLIRRTEEARARVAEPEEDGRR